MPVQNRGIVSPHYRCQISYCGSHAFYLGLPRTFGLPLTLSLVYVAAPPFIFSLCLRRVVASIPTSPLTCLSIYPSIVSNWDGHSNMPSMLHWMHSVESEFWHSVSLGKFACSCLQLGVRWNSELQLWSSTRSLKLDFHNGSVLYLALFFHSTLVASLSTHSWFTLIIFICIFKMIGVTLA